MRKMIVRITSVFLMLVVLLLSASPFVSAADYVSSQQMGETILSIGDTKINYLERVSGERVYIQYVDNRLDQINILDPNSPEMITRQFYDRETSVLIKTDTLNVGSVMKSTVSSDVSPMAIPSSYTTMGYITYQYDYMTEVYTSNQTVAYRTTSLGNTSYTINGYMGTVVDLATLLASVLIPLPASIANLFIAKLVLAAGITVTGGVIKEALTTTVACVATSYSWYLHSPEYGETSLNNIGTKYVVTDTVYNTGETYTEGITTFQWGTGTMSSRFYQAQYPVSTWTVLNWVRYRTV